MLATNRVEPPFGVERFSFCKEGFRRIPSEPARVRGTCVTIAMCYVAPEGVVLGADSTASATPAAGHFHFFNHNQKIFEVGENSSLGLLTWGLGGLPGLSFRTLVARLGDNLAKKPGKSVQDVADRWAAILWGSYSALLKNESARVQILAAKPAFDPNVAPPAAGARTESEEREFNSLMGNYVGFCLGGYCAPDRDPQAYKVEIYPTDTAKPTPAKVDGLEFWGAPNFILRSLLGFDTRLIQHVMQSGKWTGTPQELLGVLGKENLSVPANLPIRDAIDFVYSSIHQTIKALKFSNLNQICGGPIEIAVITTDRNFRWVRHKEWQAAIMEGEAHDSAHAKLVRS